jgi:hypothetical protein
MVVNIYAKKYLYDIFIPSKKLQSSNRQKINNLVTAVLILQKISYLCARNLDV